MFFQIDGDGKKAHNDSGSVKGLSWAKPLSNFVANNFLPLGDFYVWLKVLCFQIINHIPCVV